VLERRAHLAGTNVFALGVRGLRIWNNVDFSNFPLFDKLPCRAFGDSLKVASDVNMQCFIRLGRYHFDASGRSAVLYFSSEFPSFPFIESLPRKNR
jgi:hypothetical protein